MIPHRTAHKESDYQQYHAGNRGNHKPSPHRPLQFRELLRRGRRNHSLHFTAQAIPSVRTLTPAHRVPGLRNVTRARIDTRILRRNARFGVVREVITRVRHPITLRDHALHRPVSHIRFAHEYIHSAVYYPQDK